MSVAGGVISILDWLKNKLPIPDRVEGIKNTIDKLERERDALYKKEATIKDANRLNAIDMQLSDLNKRLRNIAKD